MPSTQQQFSDLPLDILYPILEHINDARDWCRCALVNKTFNRTVTPLLYRNLDTRISKDKVHHPATTILKRPELAQHVHAITESGSLHFRVMNGWSDLTQEVLKVLSLCTCLRALTWTDDSKSRGWALIAFLQALQARSAQSSSSPLEELNIRTHNDPAPEVWEEIHMLRGLKKVTIWCMEGPPRVLQGWSEALGPTLTTLELGRCAGVPPTILIAVLMHLPHLIDLRLKGAPASVLTSVLAVLPALRVLDTEYLPALGRPRQSAFPLPTPPGLESLTVRASSGDYLGPQKLWPWILQDLIPGPAPSLRVFALHSFIMNLNGKESMAVPRQFILEMCRVHGERVEQVLLGDAQVTVGDVECLCEMCPGLEVLEGSTVLSADKVGMLKKAIESAKNLRSLTLQIAWIHGDGPRREPLTLEDARDWMLRSEDSRLRYISVNDRHYSGQWVLEEDDDETEPSDPDFKDTPAEADTKAQSEREVEFQTLSEVIAETKAVPTHESKAQEENEPESEGQNVEETGSATSTAAAITAMMDKVTIAPRVGQKKLKFVVTTDLEKDRWFIRFGREPGMARSIE